MHGAIGLFEMILDFVEIHGDFVPLFIFDLREYRGALADAHAGGGQAIPIAAIATAVVVPMCSAPDDSGANHQWVHTMAIVNYGHHFRLFLRRIIRLVAERHMNIPRSCLYSIVVEFVERISCGLVAYVAHSLYEGIREHNAVIELLGLQFLDVITLPL